MGKQQGNDEFSVKAKALVEKMRGYDFSDDEIKDALRKLKKKSLSELTPSSSLEEPTPSSEVTTTSESVGEEPKNDLYADVEAAQSEEGYVEPVIDVPQIITESGEELLSIPKKEDVVKVQDLPAPDGKYKIDGKPVRRWEVKEVLFDKVDDVQSGKIDIEINDDQELMSLLEHQVNSGGQWGDKWESLEAGAFNVMSGVAGAQSYLADLAEEVTGIPFSQTSTAIISKESAKKLQEKAAESREKVRAYSGDFIESIASGDFAAAGNIAFNTTAESLPITLAAMATGGAGGGAGLGMHILRSAAVLTPTLTSAEYAAADLDPNQDDLSRAKKLLRSAIYGGSEAVFEGVTGYIGNASFGAFKSGLKSIVSKTTKEAGKEAGEKVARSIAEKSWKDIAKSIGVDMNLEGASEGMTQVIQDMTDDLMGVRDLKFSDYVHNFANAYGLGAAMGSIMGGSGKITGKAVSDITKLRNNDADISGKLAEKVESGEITEEDAVRIERGVEAVSKTNPKDTEEKRAKDANLIKRKEELESEVEAMDKDVAEASPQKKELDEVKAKLSGETETKKTPFNEKETPILDERDTIETLEDIEEKYEDLTLDVFEKGNVLSLGRIVIPEGKRGEGVGSNVMQDLIDYADKNNLKIILTPSTDFGATSVARLNKFYKKFGFIDNRGKNRDFSHKESMYRVPEESQQEGQVKPDVSTTEVKDVVTPEILEQGKKEVTDVTKGTFSTANPVKIFKGIGGKKDLQGFRINAHKGAKGVFSSVDSELAATYGRDEGVAEVVIPKGTSIEVVEVDGTGMGMSDYRAAEVKAINNSDAQIVKLITIDGVMRAGEKRQQQYVIKDDSLIEGLKKEESPTSTKDKVSTQEKAETRDDSERVKTQMQEAMDMSRNKLKKSGGIVKSIKRGVGRALGRFVDSQFNPKRLLKKAGMDKVADKLVTMKGAGGAASFAFKPIDEKIYDDLGVKEREELDTLIVSRRIAAIEKNRKDRGLDPIKHPNNVTGEIAEQEIENIKERVGEKAFKRLQEKADTYFNAFRKNLTEAKDAGLISKDMYEKLIDLDYQPRKFLEFLLDEDFGGVSDDKLGKIANDYGLSKGLLKSLDKGSSDALITDSRWLLSTAISSMKTRIFQNKLNKSLAKELPKLLTRIETLKAKENLTKKEKNELEKLEEVSNTFKDNPIIGYSKGGKPKYKYKDGSAAKIGYKNAYYYEDGLQKRILIKENVYDEWFDNKRIFLPKLKKVLANASGSNLLKMMATGNNPLFVMANLPRDFGHVVMFSDEYSDIVPVAMAQLSKDTSLAWKEMAKGRNSKIYSDFVNYGGMLDFLYTQGKFNTDPSSVMSKIASDKNRAKFRKLMDTVTVLNKYSEVGFRLAIFDRAVRNGMKKIEKSNLEGAEKEEAIDDLKNSAAAKARNIIDFSQGGYITKDLESLMPYLNASVQGARVAAESFKERPVGTTLRAVQGATFISAGVASLSLALIGLLGDDDEPAEKVYSETMDNVSEFEKERYFIIPTGKKDKDGNREYYRIAKTQAMTPLFAISDHYTENLIRRLSGQEEATDFFMRRRAANALFGGAFPIDIRRPSSAMTSLATRSPLIGGTIEAYTGYDFFRDKPLTYDINDDDIPERYKGRYGKNMQQFYVKSVDFLNELPEPLSTDVSPAKMKHFTEKFVTSPSTNPYTAFIYAGLDASVSDDELPKALSDGLKGIKDIVSRKAVRYTNPNTKSFKNKEELNKRIREVNGVQMDVRRDLYEMAQEHKTGEKSFPKNVKDYVEKLDKPEQKAAYDKYKRYVRQKDAPRGHLDIIYERNPEIQSILFMDKYGVVDDGDLKDVFKELSESGFKPSKRFIYEYKKLRDGK